MPRKPKTYPITHKLLNQTIKTLKNAIPQRSSGYCPICGSHPFWPCSDDCDIWQAKRLLEDLRELKKPAGGV